MLSRKFCSQYGLPEYQYSLIEYRYSHTEYRYSLIEYRYSSTKYWYSHTEYRYSSIEYWYSSIEYWYSFVEYQYSSTEYRKCGNKRAGGGSAVANRNVSPAETKQQVPGCNRQYGLFHHILLKKAATNRWRNRFLQPNSGRILLFSQIFMLTSKIYKHILPL